MGDPLPFETPPEAPPGRRAAPLAWALTALVVVVALLAAGWQFLERRSAEDDLQISEERVADLEDRLRAAEMQAAEARAAGDDLAGVVEDEREAVAACREALERLSRAWDAVARALNSAGSLAPSEVERFRREANENRRRAAAAAGRCG